MNKKIFLSAVEDVKENVGHDFPKIANLCDRTKQVAERNLVNGLSFFINEFDQYTNVKDVEKLHERVGNYIDDNVIRLNLMSARTRLANSNSSINVNLVDRVDKVLESDDEDLVKNIKNKLNNYKFISEVRHIFDVIEEAELNEYEENKGVDEAKNNVQQIILRALGEVNENYGTAERKTLRGWLRKSRSANPLLIAEGMSNISENEKFEVLNDVIHDMRQIAESNQYSLIMAGLVENLENHRNSVLFKNVLPVIKRIAEKDESELRDNIVEELSDYGWVPGVSDVVQFAKQDRAQQLNEAGELVKRHPVSPVVTEERSAYIKLGETIYEYADGFSVPESVSDSVLARINEMSEMLSHFKIDGEKLVYESSKSPLTFDLSGENVEVKLGQTVLEDVDGALRLFGNEVSESAKIAIEYFASGKAEDFVVVDEAIEIGSGNFASHIIATDKNLIKNGEIYEDGDKLAKEIAEEYGIDISTFVLKHLDEERQAEYVVESRLSEAEKLVNFYSNQIAKIDRSVENIDEHQALYELRGKLLASLRDAERQLATISSTNESIKENGFGNLVTEAEEADELDSDEALEYFRNTTDSMDEDEMSDEAIASAESELQSKLQSGDGVTKEDVEKIINSQEQIDESAVNESSYTDFLMDYGDRVRRALKQIDDMRNRDNPEFDDPEFDNFFEGMKRELRVYDKDVIESVIHWAGTEGNVDPNDIANLAIRNYDRNGTEPRMVLNAIDDLWDFHIRKGYIDPPRR